MTLRARLTLIYTTLLGGSLLLFGVALYSVVTIFLVNQIDEALQQTYQEIFQDLVLATGSAESLAGYQLPPIDPTSDVFVQVWNAERRLVTSSIEQFNRPLDNSGFLQPTPVYRSVFFEGFHIRVLTVPLMRGDRLFAVLQLGASLQIIDDTQRALLTVLFIGSTIAMGMVGLAGWLSTSRALSPLKAVTNTALQITRADDLSRRIYYQGSPHDEVGQLIAAFNQTLSRLENLFNTQRRFVADVGHELRTPLTVIKGNVDLVRRLGEADQESLDGIESEVDRLTRLVGDLLLLAQAESGKLPLDRRLVELDTMVLEAMQQMRVLARDRLSMRLGEIDQVLVCGDQDRLKQVLVNLIGNAIKYTPPGGEVIVGLGKEGNQAKLTVSDTGPGIPAEDIPHVFERFYRGEKSRTRTRDGKGFGLGLSIAYWIVRNHGGRIEVNSRPGQGSTFCVWLPLAVDDCLS
ncbi:MAG TPA: HAMP domain-containing sensor histidine kinase [Anaerolineales bacterium]|nr:HAMP domain-containing sensor histidine kinase [Anaerolineales bacterium]